LLSGDAVAIVLYALTTGFPDRAVSVVATSEEVDERERAVLWAALTSSEEPSAQARRFGDALRSLGAARQSVNEAYRAAFYSSDDWKSLSGNPLFAYFVANRGGTPLDKWVHYFAIYDRHLARYRGSAARLLEIGVYRGGGLDMFSHYLGPAASLVGLDIDESGRAAVAGRYPVEVGDQQDPAFLQRVVDQHGPFDIVIDDGGHTMQQQITSVETLFPLLADGGVYIVEDCHTSYWPEFADSADPSRTFVGWAKERLDDLHAYHHSVELELGAPWQTDLAAVHAYDSVIVLDKARRRAPFSEITGTSDYINVNRGASTVNLELLATREAALTRASEVEAEAARRVESADRRVAQAESEAAAAVDQSIAAAEASRDELRILRAELVAASQFAARLRTDLDDAREELDDTSSKLLGSWEIIQEMRQSRSWQITAPIRRAKSIIHRQ
jgi:cephalosporin hydroxylase